MRDLSTWSISLEEESLRCLPSRSPADHDLPLLAPDGHFLLPISETGGMIML